MVRLFEKCTRKNRLLIAMCTRREHRTLGISAIWNTGGTMRRTAFGVAAVLAMVLPLGIAQAADMAVKAPPPTPSYSWTGFYVGANVGGGWGDQNTIVAPNDPIASAFINAIPGAGGSFNSAPSFNPSGVLGGLQLGYNWRLNRNWLTGLETDFNWANVRGSNTTVTGGLFSNAELFGERIDWFGTLRGRLGYLPSWNSSGCGHVRTLRVIFDRFGLTRRCRLLPRKPT
jgi:hypothetical protein